MTIQLAVSQRNGMAQALEDDIGASGILKIFDAAKPAAITDADNGNVLVQHTLAADAFTVTAGVLDIPATLVSTGLAGGTAVHFRLYASDGTTVKQQGTVSATGGGGDLTLDNTSIAVSQTVNISGYQLTMPNA